MKVNETYRAYWHSFPSSISRIWIISPGLFSPILLIMFRLSYTNECNCVKYNVYCRSFIVEKKCFHENLLLNQFTNEKAKHVFVNFVNWWLFLFVSLGSGVTTEYEGCTKVTHGCQARYYRLVNGQKMDCFSDLPFDENFWLK